MVSGQWTLSILHRQLFVYTGTFLTLILFDSCFEFHMFFNYRNAALALPFLAFTPTSDTHCSLIMSMYVEVFTSSRVSPSSVIVLVLSVLYLMILVFPLCMLILTTTEAAGILLLLICISWCVLDRRFKLSAKSKSSRPIQALHCIPSFPLDVRVFVIQSSTLMKRKGE
ncbi:unnamed protein product [Schistosoma curassoni]|uniref:GPI ethanolamine phosphate transferase 1 n=1 Tax=Schistosoma curassoni TaxID=6186 RepID=A0A183KKV0_9TREM|nr:unnamed protein product [Schistosoma curassoni]